MITNEVLGIPPKYGRHLFIPDLFPPLVVIVNRDGENFLGLFLSDDVTIQVFVDLFRRWRWFSFLLQLFPRRSALDSLLDSFLGIRLRQDDEKVMTLFAFDESEREIFANVKNKK